MGEKVHFYVKTALLVLVRGILSVLRPNTDPALNGYKGGNFLLAWLSRRHFFVDNVCRQCYIRGQNGLLVHPRPTGNLRLGRQGTYDG
jgi:hypothetical protein